MSASVFAIPSQWIAHTRNLRVTSVFFIPSLNSLRSVHSLTDTLKSGLARVCFTIFTGCFPCAVRFSVYCLDVLKNWIMLDKDVINPPITGQLRCCTLHLPSIPVLEIRELSQLTNVLQYSMIACCLAIHKHSNSHQCILHLSLKH